MEKAAFHLNVDLYELLQLHRAIHTEHFRTQVLETGLY